MKGLLKSTFYASYVNTKIFAAFMVLAGIFAAAVDNVVQTLLIGYMLLAMVGFSVNALTSLRGEYASKWGRYHLTAPVTRAEIVMSHFVNLLGWLTVGMAFAGLVAGFSISLHGFPFDKTVDVFMIYVLGITISLFVGAAFFPLYYLGGDGFLGVSLLLGIGVSLGLVSLANLLLGDNLSEIEMVLAGIGILACSGAALGFSYPLTVWIFKRKEV